MPSRSCPIRRRAILTERIEQLQACLSKLSGTGSHASRSPRQDTKQASVLALLRRPEGASGPQIAEATGWMPHTVRGFLAGLTRKGVTVTVLERVRPLGTDQRDARGSYSVYRVAEAG